MGKIFQIDGYSGGNLEWWCRSGGAGGVVVQGEWWCRGSGGAGRVVVQGEWWCRGSGGAEGVVVVQGGAGGVEASKQLNRLQNKAKALLNNIHKSCL